jgi:formylglycine-generating enzyme required for sulfatase activity
VINYRTLDLTTGAVTTSTSLPDVTSVAATSTVMVFRRVPAGSFTMGQAAGTLGAQADEIPSGLPTAVSEFWLAVFEVTQGQWISLTGDSVTVPWKQVGPTGVVGSTATVANKPAFGVTHDEIVAKLASWNAGRSVSLRLPTSQEWEYACRAGSTSIFFWGDSIDPAVAGLYAICNDTTQGVNGTGLVGLGRTANGLNLWDMHGNVREWATTSNPNLPVLRGGSWGDNLLNSRSANKVTSVDKDFRHALSGARLVLVP